MLTKKQAIKTSILDIAPFIPSDKTVAGSAVPDLAMQLSRLSAKLSGQLALPTVQTLEAYMRAINWYYSNLIEGNATQPHEIRAAQRGDYLPMPPSVIRRRSRWGIWRCSNARSVTYKIYDPSLLRLALGKKSPLRTVQASHNRPSYSLGHSSLQPHRLQYDTTVSSLHAHPRLQYDTIVSFLHAHPVIPACAPRHSCMLLAGIHTYTNRSPLKARGDEGAGPKGMTRHNEHSFK
ncbi:MAG: hypothetical protein JKY01_10800 [Pseudomonadales bacterium]|nr:hypothetical protein [Pseudomonadales bacterium]